VDGENTALPTVDEIRAAHRALSGLVQRTPLLESPRLNQRLGGRVLFKAESLQHTGSFKFRGAYTKIAQLSAEARRRGVVAFSSGNHAQGVAAAAQMFDIHCTIVMPRDAPRLKIENTRQYGADVVLYDRLKQDRKQLASDLAAQTGATLVPPFDDPSIIAGQGTVGLEVAKQADALGARIDAVLVPCGGGGLICGCALALTSWNPGIEVYAVEPLELDDTRRSLAAGERMANPPGRRSICDSLLTESPGVLTFEINKRLLAGGLVVSDDEVIEAMRECFLQLKLVVEPGGAVGLAALLAGRFDVRGRTAAVILSGANVEPADFARYLAKPCCVAESPAAPPPK
jgi:threonine dehydratase